jgi:hypothetical protein
MEKENQQRVDRKKELLDKEQRYFNGDKTAMTGKEMVELARMKSDDLERSNPDYRKQLSIEKHFT